MKQTTTKEQELITGLSQHELGLLIMGLACYRDDGQAYENGEKWEDLQSLGNRLKRTANESFGMNWAILEEESKWD